MSGNDAMDFANTDDTWLPDQLFAQLRDFSAEYRDIFQTFPNTDVGVELGFDMQAFDFSANRIDSSEDVNGKRNFLTQVDSFNVKPEVLDLRCSKQGSNVLTLAERPHLDYPAALDLSMSVQSVPSPVVNQVSVRRTCTNTGQNFTPFGSFEEEMKILKFLEEQPRQSCAGTSVYLPPPFQIPTTAVTYGIIKCINCGCLFDAISFQTHLCSSNIVQQEIAFQSSANPLTIPSSKVLETPIPSLPIVEESTCSSMPLPATTPTVDIVKPILNHEPLLPLEPSCIRLLKENQIRIRRFLKDELKYDIYSAGNNTTIKYSFTNNETATNCSSPTESTSTETLNSSSTSTISNNGSQKKTDGPHECTLCERKFVHASGLLRHMEKHAMDLIPSNMSSGGKSTMLPANSLLQNSNGLRVVIKCTLCGRIFFEDKTAFQHLCSHFPSSWMDEKEMDNFADIPYDSYVDDALTILKLELNGVSSFASDGTIINCEEQKAPVFLKIVILTCLLQCEFCDFLFSDVSFLFVHSACHLPDRRFECFSCDIYLRTSKEICTHWQAECVFMRENIKVNQVITQRYFVCNVCENKFTSMDLLHEHRYTSYHFFPRLNKRLGILQLPCEYCELVFENVQDCLNHYEEKHYRKNRKEKEGSTNPSKTRQYLCDICGKSYTQSSHLGQHLRFHQGVKPFACKEAGCSRKFTIRPDLNDHIRKCHTGERPFHCLICGKRFLTGSVFYQHRLIHRGERRYECEECGKRFYRADALKNHQRIHTGEKPFGCLFCTKNFRQRGDRDKHMRARHSHLDENARLMMQMQKQKLQLEAAAAAQRAQQFSNTAQVQADTYNTNFYMPTITAPDNVASSYVVSSSSDGLLNDNAEVDLNKNTDFIMVGNIPFQRAMIDSFILDIDEETVQKAMRHNTLQLS